MNRVFVSYSRRDKNFAERLARDLSDAGLDVWIDFRQIHAGEMWQDEIFRGIQRADLVVVALSPDAVNSHWVQREVNTAREQGKLIIPIMAVEALTAIKQSETLNWLQDVHFIRFPNRYEEAFRELLDALPGKRSLSAFDDVKPESIPNPFKGLEAFQQTDSRFFFGREDLVRKALNILGAKRSTRFLAVVGASGSGKSSLVRAGVIPQLRAGKLPKSESWRVAIFTPGADPIEALATRLSPLLGENYTQDGIEDHLRREVTNVSDYAELILQDASPDIRLLLVVDQFEEVFTRAPEDTADLFIKLLHDAAILPDGRVQILITMRADFFDCLGRYPELAELFEQENLIIATEMTPANLLRSIEGPAKAVGLIYEDGLVNRILEDVRRQPGSLPLLQYALKALYDRRRGRYLTNAAYDEIGGVEQALAKHAEDVYVRLNAAQQDIMRRVMLRLVEVSEEGEPTRRRVQREDLTFQNVAPAAVQEIVDLMTAAESRLLITSREIKASEDTQTAPVTWLEVSHEALIREWNRFKGWIADNLENLRYGSEILKAANDWNTAGRDAAYLLTGNRLLRAEAWLENADANPLQRELIHASAEESNRQAALREAQIEREMRLQRRSTTVLRAFVAVLVVGLLVALGLTAFAINASQRAEASALAAAESARLAEISADESRSFGLSVRGERALLDNENELAVALVVEAAQVAENPPPQARLTIANVVYAPGTRKVLDQGDIVTSVVYLPDGKFALSGAVNGSLIKWDLSTGAIAQEFAGHEQRVTALAVNSTGTILISGSNDGELIVWDVATATEIRRLPQPGQINSIAISPDGRTALTASSNKSLVLWDLETGNQRARLEGHTNVVTTVAYHPTDSRLAISGGRDQFLRLWDLSTGQQIARIRTESGILSVAFSPDGSTIAAGFQRETGKSNAVVRLYETARLRSVGSMSTAEDRAVITDTIVFENNGHSDDVLTIAYSPDGRIIASGGGFTDASIILWEIATRQPVLTLNGHTNAVRAVSFNARGDRLLSASSDQTLRLWDTQSAEVIRDFRGHDDGGAIAVYGPHDRTILSGGVDNTLRLWDTQSGLTMQEFNGHTAPVLAVDLSADGLKAISGGEDQTVRVWDVTTGAELLNINVGVGAVTKLQFLPGDQQFIVAGVRAGLAIWDVNTGQRLRTFARPTENELSQTARNITALAVSADGTLLVAGGSDNRISMWNLTSGDFIRQLTGENSAIRALAISPDQQIIVAGLQNGNILLWDAEGNAIKSLVGHTRAVIGLQFSPDSKSILSAASDTTIRLWDIDSGFEVRRYTLPSGRLLDLQSLEYGSQGDTVLTGISDGSIRLWRLLPTVQDLLIWTFQNRYVPQLTCDERVQFRLDPCDAAGNPPDTATRPDVPPVVEIPGLLTLTPGVEAFINSSAGDTIRLRREPDASNNGNIQTLLADGTRVTVVEGPVVGGGLTWWKVRDEAGVEGFVAEVLPEDSLQILVPVDAFVKIAATGLQ